MVPNLPTILVADDTPSNLELVNEILGQDYELIIAVNGAEALDLAWGETPDLILLDVMMPELDGLEVCRRLKAEARTAGIPVIFLTALSDGEALLQGFQAGGSDYVGKPFNPEELRVRVATHLALKQAMDRERALRMELEAALAQVKQLSGLLPICSWCKKIRDERGEWNQLEAYLSTRSEVDFTHGVCPDCAAAFRARV